jgi:hypothetical protein
VLCSGTPWLPLAAQCRPSPEKERPTRRLPPSFFPAGNLECAGRTKADDADLVGNTPWADAHLKVTSCRLVDTLSLVAPSCAFVSTVDMHKVPNTVLELLLYSASRNEILASQ